MTSQSLQIEYVTLKDFKSYKGEYRIGPFDKHFTAIVGPNGSGKSNIIDGILFVLGYKAKKMRNSSISALINHECTSCSVTIEFNYLHIMRIAEKNNTSKYFIKDTNKFKDTNKSNSFKSIPFAKLSTLLKEEYNIDLDHNRFLILQGEIESIAMMGSMELLAYVEDCIGSSKYIKVIEENENNIVDCKQKLVRYESEIEFYENDYKFKKTKREEKIVVLNMKMTLNDLQMKIVCVKEEQAKRDLELLKEEQEKLKNVLENINYEIKQNLDSVDVNNILQVDKELEKRYYEERMKYNQMMRASEVNKNKIKMLLEEITEVENSKKEKDNLKDKIKEFEVNLESFQKSKLKLEEELLNLTTNKYSTQLNEFNKTKKDLKKELMIMIDKQNKYEKNLTVQEENIKRKKLIEIEIKKLQNLKSCNITEEQLNDYLKDKEATLREIRVRKQNAYEFKYLENQYKKEKEVINNIKHVNGYLGPLKTFNNVNKEYEVAVEAACSSLNSIVVETSKSAEEMIKIINSKNLQRTTFIILDKIDKKYNYNKQHEEYLLFKKINCEERFEPCFYFALRDTLVVDDIKTARSLAFGKNRNRVVTKDGKLLEKSGIMSGGKKVGKIKSTVELEEIVKDIQMKYDKENSIYQEYKTSGIRIKELKKELDKIKEINVQEYVNYEEEIEKVKSKLLNLESKLPEELKEHNKRCKDLENELSKINNSIFELQLKISEHQGKLNLTKNHKNLKNLKKEYEDLLNKNNFSCQIDKTKYEEIKKEYEEMIDRVDKHNKEIKECRERMDKLVKEQIQIKYDANVLKNKKSEGKKVLNICENTLAKLIEEVERIKEVLSYGSIDFENISNIEERNNCKIKKYDVINKSKEINIKEVVNEIKEQISMESDLKTLSVNYINQYNNETSECKKLLNEKFKVTEEELIQSFCKDSYLLYKSIFVDFIKSKEKFNKVKSNFDRTTLKLKELQNELEEIKNNRLTEFLSGFNIINRHLKKIFSNITFGGNAELDLLNYLDPFSDGLSLNVLPPKKSWKAVSSLSGGEKTLSSLSLIFALHKYKPSSFYIMDEIDAALDYRNVSIISQYVSRISSQFIIISLRNDMFEKAQVLVGVYKNRDVSKFITCDVRKMKN